MKILTVIANPNPKSFCHALLARFTAGLREAGHVSEVIDLYAIDFDPVFRMADFASYVHESMPPDILADMKLADRAVDALSNPILKLIGARWFRRMDPTALARFIHQNRPRDVAAQWAQVKAAEGLAFIAPVYWLGFPAILKGWFERVFAYGDAYALTREGWNGHSSGRVPLLQHKKALVISTTLFSEQDYRAEWEAPMTCVVDDWGLRYPGAREVEHVYFYGVPIVDADVRRAYLDRAYQLGLHYAAEAETEGAAVPSHHTATA